LNASLYLLSGIGLESLEREGLGKICDSRAVESLMNALKDKNWMVRLEAASAERRKFLTSYFLLI